jgi:hypothetical protein
MSEKEISRRAVLGTLSLPLSLPLILAVPSRAGAVVQTTVESRRHKAGQLFNFYRELGIDDDSLGTKGLSEQEAVDKLLLAQDTPSGRYNCGGGATYSGGQSDDTETKHTD